MTQGIICLFLFACFDSLHCRRESCKTPQTTTPVEDFPYPNPLASEEGSSEFHKRIATLQTCVQDTCKWELYHKRIRSQETSLLPTSRGYRVHSIHRAVSHLDGSTSSTNVAEGTDRTQQHRRPVLRRGASLPDLVVAADASSTPTKSTLLPHPTGRRRLGSSAAEQVHAHTYTAAHLSESSSGCSERNMKEGLSAEEKTVNKSSKPATAVSDRMVQLSPSTVTNTAEKYVQPRPPAIPPPAAKQARKKRSYSRPTSAKLVQKSKLAKTRPRTLSAK